MILNASTIKEILRSGLSLTIKIGAFSPSTLKEFARAAQGGGAHITITEVNALNSSTLKELGRAANGHMTIDLTS